MTKNSRSRWILRLAGSACFCLAALSKNASAGTGVNQCVEFDHKSNSLVDFAINKCGFPIEIQWRDQGSCGGNLGCADSIQANGRQSITPTKGQYIYAACAYPEFPKLGVSTFECRGSGASSTPQAETSSTPPPPIVSPPRASVTPPPAPIRPSYRPPAEAADNSASNCRAQLQQQIDEMQDALDKCASNTTSNLGVAFGCAYLKKRETELRDDMLRCR